MGTSKLSTISANGHAAPSTPPMPSLEAVAVQGMTVQYGPMTALAAFDFVAHEGRVASVIGPNGSGKTTFLNALTGHVPYQSGKVTVFETPADHASPRRIHGLGISRTFQNLDLIEELTVEDNVRLGASTLSRATLLEAALFAPRSISETRQRRRAARAALALLEITPLSAHRVSELSYGMRRRVEVARALASGPRVLLLDEPTAGMGPNESNDFAALVNHLRQELGLTVVLIEHDMSVVRAVADTVHVLSAGKCIASGPPATVLEQEDVKRIYLGDFEAVNARG